MWTCVRMSVHPHLCSGNGALNAPANRVPCRFKVSLIFQLPIEGPCVCVLGSPRLALLLCNHTASLAQCGLPTHRHNRTNGAHYWPFETGHTHCILGSVVSFFSKRQKKPCCFSILCLYTFTFNYHYISDSQGHCMSKIL